VIVGDNHFTPDRGGDSITGMESVMNVRTSGSAASFVELNRLDDGPVNKTTQDSDTVTCFESNKTIIVHPDFRNPGIKPDYLQPVEDLIDREGINWGEICDVGTSLRQADALTGKFDAFSSDKDIAGIAWGDPDRQKLEGQAFLREQRSGVRGDGENEGWNCTYVPVSLFTEIFETAPGIHSFAGSLNVVPGDNGTAGSGATSFLTGKFDVSMDSIAIPNL